MFKKNYIKKGHSRTKSAPFWRGYATCKHGDVNVQLKIADRENGVMEITFSGYVKHDVTLPKAKRITGKERSDIMVDAWKTNDNPSKLHRDRLLDIDADSFSAGNRTGAGVTHGTMKGIKSEAKRKYQSDNNLAKSLYELQVSISTEDEESAVKLGHTFRKFFGYIETCNITQELNIVLFNEASVRLYHELSQHDIIYIDATGKLFANENPYNRLLYYAMVIRNPYPQNPPIPISEYISSRHTAESIGIMIRKLREKEKEIFGSKQVTPALVMSDFGMAIILASLREFNNETSDEFLERTFEIVMGNATESEAAKTIHCVCSAHMMQIVKRHAKEFCGKHLQADSQVHIAMRFFGRLISCSSRHEMKDIVSHGYFIFKSKFVDETLVEKLSEFSENIQDLNLHKFSDGSENLVDQKTDGKIENYHFDGDMKDVKNVSMKRFWRNKLDSMVVNKAESGELNKYFMPRLFDYIAENYLPTWVLWSGLLLGDLGRYNAKYSIKCNTKRMPDLRNYQIDNNTNGEIEEFFKIKKNSILLSAKIGRTTKLCKENLLTEF